MPHDEWPNLGKTDPLPIAPIVLILVVCPTKLHNKQLKFLTIQKTNLMEIIFHEKNILWYYFIPISSTY